MENNFLDLTKKRRSIRKYTDKPVPRALVEYFISCAAYAPSGCDSQCWHFVAVDDKEMIDRLAEVTAKGASEFYGTGYSGATAEFLVSREKAVSFYRNAPLVIFVFMDKMKYYDERAVQAFSEKGYGYRDMNDKLGYCDVLSIGAAIQNMLLAITEKGYGACWMNDPVISEDKIKEVLGVREELKLISVVPVGEPKYSPRNKVLKELETILEYR